MKRSNMTAPGHYIEHILILWKIPLLSITHAKIKKKVTIKVFLSIKRSK